MADGHNEASGRDGEPQRGTERFAQGGYVHSGPRPGEPWVAIASDECTLRPPFDGQAVCERPTHPTPTSDSTTEDWIRHVSEVTE